MNIVAIIPARGGSKGIPGKNLRQVGGKPLLAWSIEHARQTPQISRVFVSTDAAEIAELARQYGAEVIPRPADISGDTATSESCLHHALDYLEGEPGEIPIAPDPPLSIFMTKRATCHNPDLVVFLQATSPLRESDDIHKAIALLEREKADSLFSAGRVEGFVWRVGKNGTVRSFSYDHLKRPRRQDAPEDLIENGSIYIFKPWVLRKFNNRLGGKIAVYRMSGQNSFQVDEPADLKLIEHLLAYRAASRPLIAGPEPTRLCPPLHPAAVRHLLTAELCKIRLLALDFDGVLTDNRVLVKDDATEAVWCNRSDGMGIEHLREFGIEVIVLSKETNPVVSARCRKLGVECIQGCNDKLAALKHRAATGNAFVRSPVVTALHPEEIAYVGNDVNDLPCLWWVGLPIAVSDAVPEVLAAAKWQTTKPGGKGAVREVCDLLLNAAVRGQ